MKTGSKPVSRKVRAFSLVETCIAVAICGILLVGLYGGVSWGFSLVKSSREDLRATQIALEKMETMRMYSWDQFMDPGFVPPTFTAPFFPVLDTNGVVIATGITYYGTTTITNASVPSGYSNSLRRVIVTVTWTNGTVGRSRSMETMVSQYGMQRYIY